MILLNLSDGSKREFQNVLSYEITHFSSHLILLQVPGESSGQQTSNEINATALRATTRVPKEISGTLNVVELVSDRVFSWPNVTQYSSHQELGPDVVGSWKEGYAYLAFVTSNRKTGRDRLEVALLGHDKAAWGTAGSIELDSVESLRWARQSVTLGIIGIDSNSSDEFRSPTTESTYVWHNNRDQEGFRKFTRLSTKN